MNERNELSLKKIIPSIYKKISDDVLQNKKFKHYILKGGRNSVKGSTAYSLAILKCLIEQKDLFVFVPNKELIADGCFNQVKNCLIRMGFDFEAPLNKHLIKIGGIEIKFKGLDANNSKKMDEFFKGYESVGGIGAIVFDEMNASNDPFLRNRLNTIVDTMIRNDPIYFYVFNPPKNKNHWVFNFVEDQAKNPKAIIVHSTIYDLIGEEHKFLKDEVLESIELTKITDEKDWRHRFLGESVGVEGLFWPMFDRKKIVIDGILSPKDFNVIGIDYGEQHATVFRRWIKLLNGKKVCVQTYRYSGAESGRELGVVEFANEFKKFYLQGNKKWGAPREIVIDSAAKALKIQIEKVIKRPIKNANKSRIVGWTYMKAEFLANRLYFLKNDPFLEFALKEYENSQYDQTTILKTKLSGEDMIKNDDDIQDADRYANMEIRSW